MRKRSVVRVGQFPVNARTVAPHERASDKAGLNSRRGAVRGNAVQQCPVTEECGPAAARQIRGIEHDALRQAPGLDRQHHCRGLSHFSQSSVDQPVRNLLWRELEKNASGPLVLGVDRINHSVRGDHHAPEVHGTSLWILGQRSHRLLEVSVPVVIDPA